MDDQRTTTDRLGGLEGADAASLGVTPPPASAPAEAQPVATPELPPGATFDETPNDEAKPWFSSLAAKSDQAGVANDPPDEQDPRYPDSDEPH